MNTSQLKKTESKFLMVIGTFVILVGVPALLSLFKAPEEQSLTVQKMETRSPASDTNPGPIKQTGEQLSVNESSSTSLIQYDCEHKEDREEVHGNYVRLTGMPCKEFEDMEITNQTNGFSAAVIFTKGNKFTTDFIDLSEGENNLEISATQADGSKISKLFKVVRRTPAAIKN